MQLDMDDLNREVMIDLQLGRNLRADMNQQKQIEHLTKHVRVLWHHVQRLENAISADGGSITLKTGEASIVMKKDGTIHIKGKDITIEGWGRVAAKAGSNLVLKGAQVLEN
jgi:glutamate dehydrogenase/leucine dehydrogenase